MIASTQDRVFLARARFLAERGRGRTTPNPLVGAVVVLPGGVVVGQGAHLRAGDAHAEVHALVAAADRARGATLYCTLEPCCHTGRTPPCTDRIIESGIARVVAAMRDPNPRVSGEGFSLLRARGIEVVEPVDADAAAALNAPFLTWITRQRPFVTLKLAVSADGFVGVRDRRVVLTSAAMDRRMQRQRAEVDAIAVGANTALVDDPLLTARGCYRYRPLTRVIFDSRLRVPREARVFSTLSAGPVIMMTTSEAVGNRGAHVAELRSRGVVVEVLEETGSSRISAALERLAAREILSLLVEGGPALHQTFLEGDLVDRVQWIRTPKQLGAGVQAWDPAKYGIDLAAARVYSAGGDTLLEVDVHRPD